MPKRADISSKRTHKAAGWVGAIVALLAPMPALAMSPLPPCFVGPWDVTYTNLGVSYGYNTPVGHRIELVSRGQVEFHTFGRQPVTAPYMRRRCHVSSMAPLLETSASSAEAIVLRQTRRVMACEGIPAGPGGPLATLQGQGPNFRKAFGLLKTAISQPRRPIDWSKCRPAIASRPRKV